MQISVTRHRATPRSESRLRGSSSRSSWDKSYGHCRILKKDISTARTLGLGACCALSMQGAPLNVEDANPQPQDEFKYRSEIAVATLHMELLIAMGDHDRISDFCEHNFRILSYSRQPRWLHLFRSAVSLFDFPSSALLSKLHNALEGVTEMRQALAESLFDASSMREKALRIVQNNLDQIRCAVTRADPWENNSKRLRLKILKVLEQCEALCACTPHDSWHERVRVISKCLRTRPTPWLWSTMEQLLSAAESAVGDGWFSTAELKTLTQVHDLATAYVADQFAASCAAQCAKLWCQHNNIFEPSQHVDGTLQPLHQPGLCIELSENSSLKLNKSSQCICKTPSDSPTAGDSKRSQVKTSFEQDMTSIQQWLGQVSLEETNLPLCSFLNRQDGQKPDDL
eukprot:Blabericola_migrator_1__4586@NODE_2436_length_2761_cov_8_089458_g1525_i0_p1_GENE_NODE_2436_length_2761_cov_8_089458_g1525_i0NODE_2436_length_2761_cov_8_089458_g1525_i0_p1_ORF_typecomplete_len399_score36_52FlgN/PF05130_12/0_17_NODE_2436_length_2761_cov_8_089458_g1525_i011692365